MAAYNNKEENYSSDESNYDDSTGGYSFTLLNKDLEEKFTCTICTKIIKEFTEIPCKKGHGACKTCLEKWEEQKHKGKSTSNCFMCQKEYNKQDKHHGAYMEQWITENSDYNCKRNNRGCPWKGAINDYYRDHKNECLFRKVKCPNRPCLQKIQRRHLNEHVTKECLYRRKTCSFCRKQYSAAMEMEHERMECFISCPNAGCETNVTRNNITHHDLQCDYAIVQCKYAEYGCNHKILRSGMHEHIATDAEIHNKLFIGRLNKMKLENERFKEVDVKNNEEIDRLKAHCACYKLEYINHSYRKWKGTIIHEVQFEGKTLTFEATVY